MCGVFHVSDRMLHRIRERMRVMEDGMTRIRVGSEIDIHPTDFAPVITAVTGTDAGSSVGQPLRLQFQRWGYPGVNGNGVIFNARQESVMDKKLFQTGMLERRAVIPADHFYEWNANREKNTFRRMDGEGMYFAGFYDLKSNEDRFVILTTEANESLRPVHDRMPVILEEDQLEDWIYDKSKAMDLLHQTPTLLNRSTPYEQLSLFEM